MFRAARHIERGSRLLESNGFSMQPSDGDVYCYDRCGGEPIPAGEQAWWTKTSYEYDEWEARCRRCCFEATRSWSGPWPGERLPRKPRSFMWPLNLRCVPYRG
jgi:hypothetical protein